MKTNQEECNCKYIEKINKGVSASCLVCKDTPQEEEWEKEFEKMKGLTPSQEAEVRFFLKMAIQSERERLIKEIEQWAEKKWKPIIADEIKNFLTKIRNN